MNDIAKYPHVLRGIIITRKSEYEVSNNNRNITAISYNTVMDATDILYVIQGEQHLTLRMIE